MMLYPRSAGPTGGASRGSRSNRPAALPQELQDGPLVAAAAVMVVAAVEQQPAKLVLDQPPGVNTAQVSSLASTRLLLQNMKKTYPSWVTCNLRRLRDNRGHYLRNSGRGCHGSSSFQMCLCIVQVSGRRRWCCAQFLRNKQTAGAFRGHLDNFDFVLDAPSRRSTYAVGEDAI
jgi:hypothetical protein